jgi:arabinosaccharide transport system substrate-binding protein
MPVPAWEKGGPRTTVAGGSMIGITKKAKNPELAWKLIKYLYFSPELAEHMFRESNIVSPMKPLWDLPFYDEPDPFFGGQASGRLYLDQAPDVPQRPSSPYASSAGLELGTVTIDLRRYADQNKVYDEESLIPVAQDLLDKAQARIERLIERNQFIHTP